MYRYGFDLGSRSRVAAEKHFAGLTEIERNLLEFETGLYENDAVEIEVMLYVTNLNGAGAKGGILLRTRTKIRDITYFRNND